MPRAAREVIPGLPHHVTQRGNNRQAVFFVDADRMQYLSLLEEQCGCCGVSVLGYCLMTDHVHLIATPHTVESLAKAVGRAHWLYTQYINRLHGRSGHLWQGRFYSCAVDEPHVPVVVRYIERNPVRAKLVRAPWNYRWSSAAAHVGVGPAQAVLDMAAWQRITARMNWQAWLAEKDDPEEVAQIRLKTYTGRPLASDSLLSKLESALNRRLRPLPRGRPRKQTRTALRRKQ